MLLSFARMQRMVSWSISHPGFRDADQIAWVQVRNSVVAAGAVADDEGETDRRSGAAGGAAGESSDRARSALSPLGISQPDPAVTRAAAIRAANVRRFIRAGTPCRTGRSRRAHG